jgi:small GTP-binding protein
MLRRAMITNVDHERIQDLIAYTTSFEGSKPYKKRFKEARHRFHQLAHTLQGYPLDKVEVLQKTMNELYATINKLNEIEDRVFQYLPNKPVYIRRAESNSLVDLDTVDKLDPPLHPESREVFTAYHIIPAHGVRKEIDELLLKLERELPKLEEQVSFLRPMLESKEKEASHDLAIEQQVPNLALLTLQGRIYLLNLQLELVGKLLRRASLEDKKEYYAMLSEYLYALNHFSNKLVEAEMNHLLCEEYAGFEESIFQLFHSILMKEDTLSIEMKDDLLALFNNGFNELNQRISNMKSFTMLDEIMELADRQKKLFANVFELSMTDKPISSYSPILFARKNHDDYALKIVILGDSGVGKSSIMWRYTDDTFPDKHRSIFNNDFKMKNITLFEDDHPIRLLFWDEATARSADQAIYATALSSRMDIIVLVFDITDRQSFDNLEKWFSHFDATPAKQALTLILGNKADLRSMHDTVSDQELHEFAYRHGCLSAIVSAKTGEDIDAAFDHVIEQAMMKKLALTNSKEETERMHEADADADALETSSGPSSCRLM